MGGHNAGEVASALAVETFAEAMRASGQPGRQALYSAVCRANEAVFAESERDDEKSGMGTTFTALLGGGTARSTSPMWATAARTASATARSCG